MGNRLAARSLLTYLGARPVKKAAAIRCPILLTIGEQDFTVPAEAIKQVAASAPESELHFVPGGHSDGFAGGIAHDHVLALQVDFLQRHANKAWIGEKVKLPVNPGDNHLDRGQGSDLEASVHDCRSEELTPWQHEKTELIRRVCVA